MCVFELADPAAQVVARFATGKDKGPSWAMARARLKANI